MQKDRFDIYHDAGLTLRNFCNYQSLIGKQLNKVPDHSIFFTGVDICVGPYHPDCPTLGYANIGGMCEPMRSCTINQDSGLGVAFTATHEMGHAFGIMHDGDRNACHNQQGMIMAPVLHGPNYGTFKWSQCARRNLNSFLHTEESSCLKKTNPDSITVDVPRVRLRSISTRSIRPKLPGETYSANEQCQFQFGQGSSVCPYTHVDNDICSRLYCKIYNEPRCRSILLPAAEGTKCDTNKWCRFGVCVPYGTNGGNDPVDGEWNHWSQWSECSASCGTGIKSRERKCNTPTPEYGGDDCRGEKIAVSQCYRRPCEYWMEPREIQCQHLASSKGNYGQSRYYTDRWGAYLRQENYRSCKLNCISRRPTSGIFDYQVISSTVTDGTSCGTNGQSFCIDGACRMIGCDGHLDGAKFDVCGVCNGNGTSCELNRFQWTEAVTGKQDILEIPKGSTNIRVTQLKPGSIAMSVVPIQYGNDVSDDNVPNWRMVQAATTRIADAEFYYERTLRSRHNVFTPGPILQNVILSIDILRGHNPGFDIEYYHPTNDADKITYQWLEIYGKCTESCGGGVHTLSFECFSLDANSARKHASSLLCKGARPSSYQQSCNNLPCPPRWKISQWTSCSKSCGNGDSTRTAECVQLRLEGQVNDNSQKVFTTL